MPVPLNLDNTISDRKADLLGYFRLRAAESASEIMRAHGTKNQKALANASNKAIQSERDRLFAQLRQLAGTERWTNEKLLPCILTLRHCANSVMLQTRHSVWNYEYMAFSRRIGEIWEPFVKDCFEYPVRSGVSLYIPPLFEDVRNRLIGEVGAFIAGLPITPKQKVSLQSYYDKVWSLVTAGEIKLTLDIHYAIEDTRFAVDCKSGFGSNEKGNTNRLLLVASVYKNIEPEKYRCIAIVRSSENENNNYLRTLKKSGLWEVYCASEAYTKINEFSGFDLQRWFARNVDWRNDLGDEMYSFLQENNLQEYLIW